MRPNPFVPALAALLLAAASAGLAQQGPDDLWETTMTMQADGMKMPAMTQQVCAPKGKPESRMEMDKDSNCKVVESKQAGSKFTFKMVCTDGGDSYTGTGEMEDLSKDTYRGTLTSSGVREGRKFTMRMDMSGRRVGNCDAAAIERKAAAEVAAIEKQSRDAVAKACNDAVANLDAFLVFAAEGRSEAGPCRDRQADFCASAGSVLKALRDRASWDAAQQKYRDGRLREAARVCKLDLAAVRAPLCKDAMDKQEWRWLRGNCPEAAELRNQHCKGRTYSSVEPRYSAMCAELGGLSYTAEPADPATARAGDTPAAAQPAAAGAGASPPADTQKKPSATDKLKEGAEKLKKFLKF